MKVSVGRSEMAAVIEGCQSCPTGRAEERRAGEVAVKVEEGADGEENGEGGREGGGGGNQQGGC